MPYEIGTQERVIQEFQATRCCERYELEKDPSKADLIILLESATFKTHRHVRPLLNERIVRRFSEKLLTYNFQDGAAGFLNGIYVHLERPRFNPRGHKAWSTLFPHNERIYGVSDSEISANAIEHFCVFRGSISHPLRRRLFTELSGREADFRLTLVDRWYNHNQREKQDYLTEILCSKFVLCPRGICSYTPRIFETMALGRVPVVIADDWVAPDDLDVSAVMLRVPEADIARLPGILHSASSNAVEMGKEGRKYWKKRFSKENRLVSLINLATAQMEELGKLPGWEDYRQLWKSRGFHKKNGWTLRQRIQSRIRRQFCKANK